MTFRSRFDNPFEYNGFIKMTGTFVTSQFPNVSCKLAYIKAYSANAGSIFIGGQYNTGTFPLPMELDANQDFGWFSVKNLNELYQNGASGSSYFGVWYQN